MQRVFRRRITRALESLNKLTYPGEGGPEASDERAGITGAAAVGQSFTSASDAHYSIGERRTGRRVASKSDSGKWGAERRDDVEDDRSMKSGDKKGS